MYFPVLQNFYLYDFGRKYFSKIPYVTMFKIKSSCMWYHVNECHVHVKICMQGFHYPRYSSIERLCTELRRFYLLDNI